MASRSNRIKRAKPDPTMIVANEIDLPTAQRVRANLVLVDVVNFTDADQRHMVRQAKRQTIRKLTKIEKLARAGIIDDREARACEWYAAAHAMRYDTTGTTARYGESNGGGRTNFDHMPKTKPQWEALEHYTMAREAICPTIRPMFDRVVIHGRPLGKLAITFRTAAQRLLAHIEGKVAL